MFQVQDPKLRMIHKASVRDRVLYQAVYRVLYQIFDPNFIHDVYSSRNTKGTHAGINKLNVFYRKVSANFTQPAFALKCDIRKFFDSIDHSILFKLVSRKIKDKKLLELIFKVIDSFHYTHGKGLPLGNVTSQLFANIYMNEFDQFIKHKIQAKYYIRYCDDFVVLDESKCSLELQLSKITLFLNKELQLELHPRKIEIRKIIQSVDFLGYVSLPYYKVLRTSTKNRILKKIVTSKNSIDFEQTLVSYYGMLKHCSSHKLKKIIQELLNA